jgi:hypothetical protein
MGWHNRCGGLLMLSVSAVHPNLSGIPSDAGILSRYVVPQHARVGSACAGTAHRDLMDSPERRGNVYHPEISVSEVAGEYSDSRRGPALQAL